MKRLGFGAVMVAALVAAGAPGGEGAANKELAKLQGTWKVLKAVKSGDPEPADEVQKMRVVISGDKFTIQTGEKKEEAGIKLDPAKKPAAIDIRAVGDPVTVRGIYKLEKGQLTICFTRDGKPRPKEFSSSQKAGTSLVVLEREKK
jgi:uncharacterized protein (TIGR03067 family)